VQQQQRRNPDFYNIYKVHNNWNVCFSCGFDIEDGHTSITCPFKGGTTRICSPARTHNNSLRQGMIRALRVCTGRSCQLGRTPDGKYLNERYANIIGHQGLARLGNDFPRFRYTIEMYVQHNHRHGLVDGTMTIVPGLNFMPWDEFRFIDNMIDKISSPFSGPRGNYEDAARKAEYADAQQPFYSGYVKDHGIKADTIFSQAVYQLFLDPCLLNKLTRACLQ
jgi:hypothetical protein